jgi:hypothetical protein
MVESVTRRRNGATGGRFLHLRVGTLFGALDTLLPDRERPQVGSYALVQAWLVGRPAGR